MFETEDLFIAFDFFSAYSSAITVSADCKMTFFGIPMTPGILSFAKALERNTLSAALAAKAADVPVNVMPADWKSFRKVQSFLWLLFFSDMPGAMNTTDDCEAKFCANAATVIVEGVERIDESSFLFFRGKSSNRFERNFSGQEFLLFFLPNMSVSASRQESAYTHW